MARKTPGAAGTEGNPEVLTQVASIEGTSAPDVEKLLAQISDLRAQLGEKDKALSEAEKRALEAAQAQGMSLMAQTEINEVPTGKKIKVQRLLEYETVGYKDDGRPILKPKFKTVDVETYFYKIDLPPVGGIGLTINGMPLYHGTVYEFDLNSLRTVKDMVHKVWKHEADIHGSDENVYRKPTERTLSGGKRQSTAYRG